MILCIYHANCLDGFAAALVYYLWANENGSANDIDFLPASYGDKPPEDLSKYSAIRIVDFSYPRDVLLRMEEQVPDILVLDHHKTAEEELRGLDFAKFDQNSSGCVMAWNELHSSNVHPLSSAPRFLQHIEDRDLWKFQIPGTKEICAGLRTVPFEFERWMPFLENCSELYRTGQAILSYDAQILKAVKVMSGSLDGYIFPVANIAWLWSEVGESILESFPFSATFYFLEPNKIKWSLRSRTGFDVSEIARNHGGGGHAQAAGFVSDFQFLRSVLTKG